MSINIASHEDASTIFICAGYGLPLPKSLNNVTMNGMALSVGNSLPSLPRLPSLPGYVQALSTRLTLYDRPGRPGRQGRPGRLTISVGISGNRKTVVLRAAFSGSSHPPAGIAVRLDRRQPAASGPSGRRRPQTPAHRPP